MKFKIGAGLEFDTLTPDEFRDGLRAWQVELGRGVRFQHRSMVGLKAGATTTLGLTKDTEVKPAQGMIWSVTRIYVSGDAITAGTDQFSVFRNEVSGSTLVGSGIINGRTWDPTLFPLTTADQIVIQTASTGAGNNLAVAIAAVELPEQLAWMLL